MIKDIAITLLLVVLFVGITILLKNLIFEPLFKHIFDVKYVKIITGISTVAVQFVLLYFFIKFVPFLPDSIMKAADIKRIFIGMTVAALILLISIGILRILKINTFTYTRFSFIILMSLIVFYIVTAVFEEIIFRGVIQSFLENYLSFIFVLLFSSIIFTLPHFSNDGINTFSLLSVLLGGIILCNLRYLYQSVFVPIGFHFGWNFLQGLLGYNVSGNDVIPSFIKVKTSGSDVMTGGVFGIEASVVTLFFLLVVAIILTFLSFNKRAVV